MSENNDLNRPSQNEGADSGPEQNLDLGNTPRHLGKLILPPNGLVTEQLLLQGKGFWERKVVWDLHGVIVDWMTAFYTFVNKVYDRNIDVSKITQYYAGYDGNIPLNPAEFDEMFLRFAGLSEGGYGSLKPYPGIIEAMKKIAEAGIEQEIWSWTPGSSDIALSHEQPFQTCPAQGETIQLVESMGLPIDVRTGLQFKHSSVKAPLMANLHYLLLIEDHGPTAMAAVSDFGLAAMICTQGYNKSTKDDRLVRWGDPERPEQWHDRTGIEEPVIALFDMLDDAGVLIGS